MRNRWWWRQSDSIEESVNFVWTQTKNNFFFNLIKPFVSERNEESNQN